MRGRPGLHAGKLPEAVRAERAVAFLALMPGQTAKHPARPSATCAGNHGGTSPLPTGAATPEGRPCRESSGNMWASSGRIAEAARFLVPQAVGVAFGSVPRRPWCKLPMVVPRGSFAWYREDEALARGDHSWPFFVRSILALCRG